MDRHDRMSPVRRLALALVSIVAAVAMQGAFAQQIGPDDVYARVDGEVITVGEFAAALRNAARQKYWHSGVPEAEQASFEREVSKQLIDERLLVREALRRGFEPDHERVALRLVEVASRYEDRDDWDAIGDRLLAEARAAFEGDSLRARLEASVRDLPPAEAGAVRDYYTAHPEKFTEPQRIRLSVILLKVDPSSGSAVWAEAGARAAALRERLLAGEDFAALAREYSDDRTAGSGGDMGFAHAGSLGDGVEEVVAKMAPGEVSVPLTLLEGVALVRLADRVLPALHPYEAVAERARGLLERERRDAAWSRLLERLRAGAEIEIDESLLTPVSEAPAGS